MLDVNDMFISTLSNNLKTSEDKNMKWVIIGILFAVYLFEMIVSFLNYRYRFKPIPDVLKDVYDEDRYGAWLMYSLENHRFTLIRRGFDLILLVVFLLAGLFARLETVTASWTTSPILATLYFLFVYVSVEFLLAIPFKRYQIFKIEEKYGFNKTTKKTFVKDQFLAFVMTMILGGLIVGGIHALYLQFSNNLWTFVLVSWGSITLVMILIFMFLNKVFLRLFNKFTPLPEGSLRTRIEELASSLGFNIKALSVMDASRRSTKLNAFFTGIGKSKEVVLFDTLIDKMSEDEILAVLAHELGHAAHKDTYRNLIQQILIILIYALGIGLILQSKTLATTFGLSGVHFGFALILFFILFEPIQLVLGIPLSALSRKAEFKADTFAKSKTSGEHMISALKVLAKEDLVNLNPHPLTVLLYYSHPPMKERIEAIIKA
jgi:STE24 endopeptidase